MKLILKSFAFGSAVLGGMLALSACGDDVTKVYRTTEENSGVEIAKSADDFDDCDSASLGKMMFASDENAAYVCADSGWTPLSEKASDGKDGASCTAELLSDSTGYKIMCGEDSVGVILNGKTGAKGAKGVDGEAGVAGENGTFCNVELLFDSTGYKVVCGEDSVGVILNGSDGNGCSLKDNGDGTLSQVCGTDTVTLYKALCGNVPYDPATDDCIGNSVGRLCGDKIYDSKKEFCDDRDSTVYGYLKIGTQTWMAENLNYNYNEGSAASYCYNDNADSCAKYGRLYTWAAAMDSSAKFSDGGAGCGYKTECSVSGTVRGVCPAGWHLPDYYEWVLLEVSVAKILFNDSTDSVGYALKTTSGWGEKNGNTNGGGSNALGFGALPAGYRSDGTFRNVSWYAYFWSSSEDNTTESNVWILNWEEPYLYPWGHNKYYSYSVRCVKD